MYIPSYFKETETPALIAFMQKHSFAVMVNGGNQLHATHLPFVIEQRGDKLFLVSHLAKANPQSGYFQNNEELLVIFQGAHGYVSPTNYESSQNVPTWNYMAVHAYGKASIISEQSEVIQIMEKMINTYEPHYIKQWELLSEDYKSSMIKGVTAFEIEVARLEGKYKLSQNKTTREQKNIITAFENSGNDNLTELASEMKQKLLQ